MLPHKIQGISMVLVGILEAFLGLIWAIVAFALICVILILTFKLLSAYVKTVKKTRNGEMIVFNDWKDVGHSLKASVLLYFIAAFTAGAVIMTLGGIAGIIISIFSQKTSIWDTILMIVGVIAAWGFIPYGIKRCIGYFKKMYQDCVQANQGNIEHARLALATKLLTLLVIVPGAIAYIAIAVGDTILSVQYRKTDNRTKWYSKVNNRYYEHWDTKEEKHAKDIKLAKTVAKNTAITAIGVVLLSISVGLIDSENKKRQAKAESQLNTEEQEAEIVEAQEIKQD